MRNRKAIKQCFTSLFLATTLCVTTWAGIAAEKKSEASKVVRQPSIMMQSGKQSAKNAKLGEKFQVLIREYENGSTVQSVALHKADVKAENGYESKEALKAEAATSASAKSAKATTPSRSLGYYVFDLGKEGLEKGVYVIVVKTSDNACIEKTILISE